MVTGFTLVGLMSTISSFFWILTGTMIPVLAKKSLEEEPSMAKAQSVQDTEVPPNDQTAIITTDGTVAVVTTAVSEPGDSLPVQGV